VRDERDDEGEPTIDAQAGAMLEAQTDAAIRAIATALGGSK